MTIFNYDRHHNFLDNYKFYPNSVDFRIVSSKYIQKFKAVQSFQLNEVRNGSFNFSATKRELLLLKFDIMSRVVTEVENLCIEHHKRGVFADESLVNGVINLFNKGHVVFERSILKNVGFFDLDFTNKWFKFQQSIRNIGQVGILSYEGLSISDFFIKFVDMKCLVLQNMLIELFELSINKDHAVGEMTLVISDLFTSNQLDIKLTNQAMVRRIESYGEIKKLTINNQSGFSCDNLIEFIRKEIPNIEIVK